MPERFKRRLVPIAVGVLGVIGLIAVASSLTGGQAPKSTNSNSSLIGVHVKDFSLGV